MSNDCRYVGHLPDYDPLHHYLQYVILPRMGISSDRCARFRVFRMGGSNEVYLYEEKHTHAQAVGKFFAGNGQGGSRALQREQRMAQEFNNLRLIRSYGLVGYPHDIVRPLGCNGSLNGLLVEEYRGGQSLSNVITDSIFSRRPDRLHEKLTALAYFLATFHNRTANGEGVNFHDDCAYLDRIVGKLVKEHFIDRDEVQELSWLRERWREQPRMWEDQQVIVHGDATPANFLFGKGLRVTGIDLERMKRADRTFDVGRIAGELQHFFLQSTGNKYAAEPFIRHFLREYASHFPDRDSAFRSITGRVPFQMGLTLLRIARNSWIDNEYRRRLLEEAKITLRTF
jgi:aminoglycoside phosphotransferase (APT) family kinase protein